MLPNVSICLHHFIFKFALSGIIEKSSEIALLWQSLCYFITSLYYTMFIVLAAATLLNCNSNEPV